MQTLEKNSRIATAIQHFQDQNWQGVEQFGMKIYELATTPGEVTSLLADNRKYVKYSPDSGVTDHAGLTPDRLYALGTDGNAYEPLTQEILLAVGIAAATGASLDKATSAQQVIDYVQAEKLRALTKLGDGVLENAQYGANYPTDLLPADGSVDADTVYFAMVDAGSVIGGETYDVTGFVYGIPSDNTHAGVTWKVIDPFDGLTPSTDTITDGDASLATANAVYDFVTGITSVMQSSINDLQTTQASHATLITVLQNAVQSAQNAADTAQTSADNAQAAANAAQAAADAAQIAADQGIADAADANTLANTANTLANNNVTDIQSANDRIDGKAQEMTESTVTLDATNYTQATGVVAIPASVWENDMEMPRFARIKSGMRYSSLLEVTYGDGVINVQLSKDVDATGQVIALWGAGKEGE